MTNRSHRYDEIFLYSIYFFADNAGAIAYGLSIENACKGLLKNGQRGFNEIDRIGS